MSLRGMIQGLSEELAAVRRRFERAWFFNRRSRRDALLIATAYGVQNCLRSLAMLHSDGPAPGLLRAVASHKANTASADTLPEGQDAQQGLAGTESGAVPEGQTPNPSSSPAAGR